MAECQAKADFCASVERRGLGTGPGGVVSGQRKGQHRHLEGPARREEEKAGVRAMRTDHRPLGVASCESLH